VTAERWTMRASPESPGLARRLVRAFAVRHGVGADVLPALAVCVSEAVSNAVIHAYQALDEPGEVEANMPDSSVCLYVRDQGRGCAPRVDSPGLGLGLPIIATNASTVEVRTLAGGGTEVVMRFDLVHPPAATG
jgi:anti-sigma regulatory factor (Ser/Thr protein kinase)